MPDDRMLAERTDILHPLIGVLPCRRIISWNSVTDWAAWVCRQIFPPRSHGIHQIRNRCRLPAPPFPLDARKDAVGEVDDALCLRNPADRHPRPVVVECVAVREPARIPNIGATQARIPHSARISSHASNGIE